MQRKILGLLLSGLITLSFLNWGCTKIDSTTLGADLIPAVDNVSTFDTVLNIEAGREALADTIRLSRSEAHVLGSINNDPVFGKTKADIFLQLKPTFFPFYLGNAKDTINPTVKPGTKFDSVVLCLAYTGFYGDTSKPQHFKVYELNENTTNFVDSTAHYLNFQPNMPLGNLVGEATVYQPGLKDYVFLKTSKKDSVQNQIRIRLNEAFLSTLVKGDSAKGQPNNFFNSDSLYKTKYKGLAVVADGGNDANGLFYISLTNAATRLEVHYVAANGGKLDTAFSTFTLSSGSSSVVSPSANANSVKRDSAGAVFPNNPDPNALYIQSAPGSAINIKIPGLSTLSNRIIHRAEIFVEQVPGGAFDNVLTPPQYLYLDIINDTGSAKYKPLYYDLSPNSFYNPDNSSTFFPSEGVDQNYFGGFLRTKTETAVTRGYYTFNLTRYVQNLVTKGGINYRFRVFAPYNLYYNGFSLIYKNNLGYGRVKIDNNANSPNRIRMRIVYSRL